VIKEINGYLVDMILINSIRSGLELGNALFDQDFPSRLSSLKVLEEFGT
jgi:hypothetical protein